MIGVIYRTSNMFWQLQAPNTLTAMMAMPGQQNLSPVHIKTFTWLSLAGPLQHASCSLPIARPSEAGRSRGEAGPTNLSPLHIKTFTCRSEAGRSRGEAGMRTHGFLP